MTIFSTQRAEDRALGLPLTKRMVEDPKKRGVPLFLQAQNTRSSNKVRERWATEMLARSGSAPASWRRRRPNDCLKPKGMSWEDWDALEERRCEEKRAKSYERVAELRARQPDKPPAPRRATRADALPPEGVIRVLVDKNPCRLGTAAHAMFARYRSGMTVAEFVQLAGGACAKNWKPTDYLVCDVRRGRIKVEGATVVRVRSRSRGRRG